MKKVFYLLVSLLLLPNIVKADMFGPNVIEYKAVVNNPDGIYIYICEDESDSEEPVEESTCVKSNEKVPYGTVYTLISDDYICIDDDTCSKFIDPKELTAVDNNFKIDSKNLGEKFEATILVDMEIKKGPAVAYEGTGKVIKAGTKINVTEVLFENVQTPWFYVEYDGVKGFIDSYYEQLAFNIKESTIISYEEQICNVYDFNMYDRINGIKTNPIKKLEANKKYNVKLGTFNLWSKYLYIEIDNIKGKIPKYYMVVKQEPIEYKLNDDINLYNNGNDISESNIKTKLTKGTTITCEYYELDGIDTCYYENGNINGWINISDINKSLNDEKDITDNEKEEKPIETITKPKKDYTLYICIGSGIILSITAAVIVILINKKKKNKEN